MSTILNKEEAVRKINKGGKVGRIISTIIQVIVIIALVFTIAGTVIVTFIPDNFISVKAKTHITVETDFGVLAKKYAPDDVEKFIDEARISIENNPVYTDSMRFADDKLIYEGTSNETDVTMKKVIFPMLLVDIALAFTLVTVTFVRNLCKALEKSETPFAEDVIKKMRAFALSLIPWTVFSMASNSLTSYLQGTDRFYLQINLATVFVILIIFGLSYIFTYGAVLQTESDETI